jgi:hypothetical protein
VDQWGIKTFPTKKKIENILAVSSRPCAATRSSHAVAGPGRHFDFAVAHGWEAAMWRRTATQ